MEVKKLVPSCPDCPYFEKHDGELDVCLVCGIGRTRANVADIDQQDYVRREEEDIHERIKYFKRLYRRFLLNVRKGRMLDVGCADALLIDTFEQYGWQVMGIDPYLGLDVSDSRLKKMQLADLDDDEKFDLITMVHSLEHMPNPVEVMSRCKELLSEKGLVLIVVPNLGGSWARITGKEWHMRNAGHHYFHYTKQGLVNMLTRCAYRIIDIKTYSGYAPSPSQSRRAIRQFYGRGLPSFQPFRSVLFRINNLTRPIWNLMVDRALDGAELQVLVASRR